jgi:hypothetical protein
VYYLFISFLLAIVDGAEIVINVIWAFIINCLFLYGHFGGRFVSVFPGRRGGCLQQSLPVHCCVQLPNHFHFSTAICYHTHSSLCLADVGVRFSVFLHRLSGDLPRFSRLLIQVSPESRKLVILAATLFAVCRPLTLNDQ